MIRDNGTSRHISPKAGASHNRNVNTSPRIYHPDERDTPEWMMYNPALSRSKQVHLKDQTNATFLSRQQIM